MRYRRWSTPIIQEELERLVKHGVALDQETLADNSPALLAAIYRVGAGLVAERSLLEERLVHNGNFFPGSGDERRKAGINTHLASLFPQRHSRA